MSDPTPTDETEGGNEDITENESDPPKDNIDEGNLSPDIELAEEIVDENVDTDDETATKFKFAKKLPPLPKGRKPALEWHDKSKAKHIEVMNMGQDMTDAEIYLHCEVLGIENFNVATNEAATAQSIAESRIKREVLLPIELKGQSIRYEPTHWLPLAVPPSAAKMGARPTSEAASDTIIKAESDISTEFEAVAPGETIQEPSVSFKHHAKAHELFTKQDEIIRLSQTIILQATLEAIPFVSQYMPEKNKVGTDFEVVTKAYEHIITGRRQVLKPYTWTSMLPTFVGTEDDTLPFRPIIFAKIVHTLTKEWSEYTIVAACGTRRITLKKTFLDFEQLDSELRKSSNAMRSTLPVLPEKTRFGAKNLCCLHQRIAALQDWIDFLVDYTTMHGGYLIQFFEWCGFSYLRLTKQHILDLNYFVEEIDTWPFKFGSTAYVVSCKWLGYVKELLTVPRESSSWGDIPGPMDNGDLIERVQINDDPRVRSLKTETPASALWVLRHTGNMRGDGVDFHNLSVIHEAKQGPRRLKPVLREDAKIGADFYYLSPAMFQLLTHVYGYPRICIQHSEVSPDDIVKWETVAAVALPQDNTAGEDEDIEDDGSVP